MVRGIGKMGNEKVGNGKNEKRWTREKIGKRKAVSREETEATRGNRKSRETAVWEELDGWGMPEECCKNFRSRTTINFGCRLTILELTQPQSNNSLQLTLVRNDHAAW